MDLSSRKVETRKIRKLRSGSRFRGKKILLLTRRSCHGRIMGHVMVCYRFHRVVDQFYQSLCHQTVYFSRVNRRWRSLGRRRVDGKKREITSYYRLSEDSKTIQGQLRTTKTKNDGTKTNRNKIPSRETWYWLRRYRRSGWGKPRLWMCVECYKVGLLQKNTWEFRLDHSINWDCLYTDNLYKYLPVQHLFWVEG